MFELVLTVCLAGDPAACAERLAPPAFAEEAACHAEGTARAEAWTEARDGTVMRARRCVPEAELAQHVPPLAVEEVAPGVFAHQGRIEDPDRKNAGDVANLGFIIGEKAVAVIDAGGSRAVGERLYSAIRAKTDLPIRWLILTHMHPDHTLGAAVFQEAGAAVVGHPKLAEALDNRASTYLQNFQRLLGDKAFLGTTLARPETAPESIDLGGRVLRLIAHDTAHTDNDLSVLDEQTGVWFAGDLAFVQHTPALDGSLRGWLALLEGLGDDPRLKGARLMVPGHGPAILPFPDGAAPTREYLAGLAAETREALAKGESMSDAVAHLGQSRRGDWLLFDEFNPRNATAAYKELEWE